MSATVEINKKNKGIGSVALAVSEIYKSEFSKIFSYVVYLPFLSK